MNGDEVRWDEFFYWFHTDYDRYFSGRSLDESIDGETTVGEYLAMNAASYCVPVPRPRPAGGGKWA